jgi:hypothetical protein
MVTKATFKKDHTYVRESLSRINDLMKQDTAQAWSEIAELYCELSGVFGGLEDLAIMNSQEK